MTLQAPPPPGETACDAGRARRSRSGPDEDRPLTCCRHGTRRRVTRAVLRPPLLLRDQPVGQRPEPDLDVVALAASGANGLSQTTGRPSPTASMTSGTCVSTGVEIATASTPAAAAISARLA